MSTVLKYLDIDGVTWKPFTGDVPAPTSSIVVKGSVTGAINGVSNMFNTGVPYVAGTLQGYINGSAQSNFVTESSPSTGLFAFDVAPSTGDNIYVYFHVANTGLGNSDTVDNYNASAVPTANNIPVLDNNAKMTPSTKGGLAFKARRGTSLTSGTNASVDLIFDLENYDYGNWYSPVTGLATAPISGIYHFAVNAFTETSAPARAFFSTRGTATSGLHPNGTARANERARDGTQTAINRIEGNFELYVAAGETFGVTLWTSAANQLNSQDTWFTGHLVMAV